MINNFCRSGYICFSTTTLPHFVNVFEFSLAVSIIGGVLAIAGQFKNWQFGVYVVYPFLVHGYK